jgi:hypothetical protein
MADIIENFEMFLENKKDWESANAMIVEARGKAQKDVLPAIVELESVVSWEVEYQTALWRSDFVKAVDFAERVLGALTLSDLRGYRALWNYLAGSAAYLGAQSGIAALAPKARHYFGESYKCAPDISWLSDFARRETPDLLNEHVNDAALQQQVTRIAAELTRLGSTHDRAFAKLEKDIIDGLQNHETFEAAQVKLGNLIGFIAGKIESEGSPDPWWISGSTCIVFEDYVNTTSDGELPVVKARQATSHPDWMKTNVPQSLGCSFIPTLLSPINNIRSAAVTHAQGLRYWQLDAFLAWAKRALDTVRELRTTFYEQGDLVWQADASALLKERELDILSLLNFLNKNMVIDSLRHV